MKEINNEHDDVDIIGMFVPDQSPQKDINRKRGLFSIDNKEKMTLK